ncbi:MAG TPA: MATE family efflux transporter, partial [Firmicutes bacterium]|nr:MATE family efflux transporter [Bacillota bacterium]HCF90950.1 MATE family efflux transporter [Bacillota bacterium]
MARDLTKGSITKNLLFMAVPSMIGFGAQMLYDLIDIFWLGQLSSSAVA